MNNFPAMNMSMPGMSVPGPSSRPQASPNGPNAATLYVGNLDKDLDEQRLYEYFSQYGPCGEIKIKRDMYSGESRGFGFVTYFNLNDAKRAKLVLNHTKIQSREIRISFKRNLAQLNPKANLYVSNLDETVSSRQLEETCSEHGTVLSCVVRTDENDLSLGYGYVQFENEKDAEECIAALDGKKLQDKEVSVKLFVPRGRRNTKILRNNLYLKNFPPTFDQGQIEEFIATSFKDYGEIVSQCINKEPKLGLYYAFVAFKENDKAKQAVTDLTDHVFEDGTQLYIDFAQSKMQRRKMLKQKHLKYKNETNLYIRSIKLGVTEEQLKAAFEKYGTINSSCLKSHSFPKKGAPEDELKALQFGFLNFPNPEEAKQAFTEGKKDQDVLDLIDSTNVKGDFIFYAQPKPVRNQYLRMVKKNSKVTQMFANSFMNPMRFFAQAMKKFGGNKRPKRQQKGRNPQEMFQQFPMQGFPQQFMMMQQQMNPNFQQMMMQQQQQMQQMQQMQRMQQNNLLQPQQQMMMNLAQQQQQMDAANPQAQQAQGGDKNIAWLTENIDEFNNKPHNEKKNILGTLMYAKVVDIAPPHLVPKITGMLIDLEVLGVAEIIEILSDDELLKERIDEAVKIIEDDNEGN